MKTTIGALLMFACAVTGAAGLDSLEPQPSAFDGLPRLDRPIFLKQQALVCEGSGDIVGTSKAFLRPPEGQDAQLIVQSLRAMGCAFSDKETRVTIRLPDINTDEYRLERQWQYVGIVWRNKDGSLWSGYTMIDNLHN